jgi:tryptophan synthase alpha chain
LNSELIDHAFGEATAQGRIALLGYLPAAWPSESGFRECVEAAFLAGLDILEVGLPAEDPFMDGDVIRKAVASVRRRGVSVASALESIIHPEEGTDCCGSNGGSPARVESRAIIAMMYLSSYIELGRADVPRRLAALGYAGLLVVGTDTDTWLEYTPAALAGLGADGAIVGTSLVRAANDPDRLSKYVASLRAATQRDGNGKGSA